MPLSEFMQDVGFLGSLPAYVFVTLASIILAFLVPLKEGPNEFIVASVFLLGGLGLLYIMVCGIRLLYFKQRPKKQSFQGFFERIDASSFPSMHAARSVVLSAGIWFLLRESGIWFVVQEWVMINKDWLISLFLGMFILLTGVSRVWLKRHYWSDIIVGWIIGTIVTIVAYFMVL